jgi:hypothetical protein
MMQATMQRESELDLAMEELEPLEAPCFWCYVAGIGAGVALGAGAVAVGLALT